ncbi:MAG: phytoene/squalene synthase family protein [Pseudomonadota bacterium]
MKDIPSEIYAIFKGGSKTYFNSSIFFPAYVRRDVFILYAFVRKADDLVDCIPQDAKGFFAFKKEYKEALEGKKTDDIVISYFIDLLKRKPIDPKWIDSFLVSMEMDLTKNNYENLDETLQYIYGSAEVIGLCISALLGLPEKSYYNARMQGRSMQYINFIRDIDEDLNLGRTYLPLGNSGLKELTQEEAVLKPKSFANFIHSNLLLYKEWQIEAEAGYKYIPRRYLIPIKTASDMYNWTALQIEKNPMIVFDQKAKPSKPRILWSIISNCFHTKRLS